MIVLAIDPGFDATGWACFETTEDGKVVQGNISSAPRRDQLPLTGNVERQALKSLISSGAVVPVGVTQTARLADLQTLLFAVAADMAPDLIIVETPAIAGTYRRNQASRATLNKLYMALGVVLATLEPFCHVVTQRAGTARKEDRHMVLENVASQAGVELPLGPRGGRSGPIEDEWDAIWVGYWALTTGYVAQMVAGGSAVV